MTADAAAKTVGPVAVVYVEPANGATAGTRRASWRRGVCFFQLIADPREAQMAGSAIALDIGYPCDLIAVIHVALVNAIRGAQELPAVLTGCGHLM